MNRYVLHFKGSRQAPSEDLRLIRAKANVVDAGRKTLLVEVKEDEVAYELARKLPDWSVKKEVFYQTPPTRPQVRKTPAK